MDLAGLAATMAPTEIAAIGLLVVGAVFALIGGIGLLIAAFRQSVLWGLGTLFVPFVGLIFVIVHWSVAKRPFLACLAGYGLIFLGATLGNGFRGI